MKDIYLWAGPETCLWLLMQSTLDMGLYWENKIDFVDQTTMLVTLKRMQVDKVKFWRSFISFDSLTEIQGLKLYINASRG